MDPIDATNYLTSLLNRLLRVHTNDTRMFVGEFKCTDNERNIILARCYEYRPPTTQSMLSLAPTSPTADSHSPPEMKKADMTSRFLGLVVVPGHCIVKIEVEEAV
ncbi:MAG: hypothetical protein Q9187_004883 [Circinaria calcarea]